MTASRYVSPLAGLPRLLLLEARLLLGGQPWLWHAGALGLLVAQVLAPLEIVRPHLVTFALIWPLLVWSPMGCRDRLLGTLDLMNATPQPSLRQLPASWLAGVGIGVAITLPAFVRLAVSGDTSAAVALALAWLVPPSLAIAAGTWSGNARLFEAVYLLLWYVGILNRIPQLDFAGTTDLAIARGTPAVAAMAAMVLLVSAWLRRGRLSRER